VVVTVTESFWRSEKRRQRGVPAMEIGGDMVTSWGVSALRVTRSKVDERWGRTMVDKKQNSNAALKWAAG